MKIRDIIGCLLVITGAIIIGSVMDVAEIVGIISVALGYSILYVKDK